MRLLLILSSLAVIGCATPPAPAPCVARDVDNAAAKRAIEQNYVAFAAALRRGDAAGCASLFAPDGAILQENVAEPIRGPAAIRGFCESALKSAKLADAGFQILEVEAFGDTAYEVGTSAFTFAGPPPATMRSKYVVIWKRQPDGSWKAFRDISNSSDPARPAGAR